MAEPLVSVIVPVYCVEKYLEECIETILQQSYQNLEIILVDDGSPDRCPSICDALAVQHPNIRVIHKPNGGLSSARNAGIDLANGEYLTFVDSDDLLSSNFIQTCVGTAQEFGVDIVTAHLRRFSRSAEFYNATHESNPVAEVISKTEQLTFFLSMKDMALDNCAPGRLYRAFLFNRVRFPEGLLYEDLATTYRLVLEANSIAIVHAGLYGYRYNSDGITHGAVSDRKLDSYIVGAQLIRGIESAFPELRNLAISRAVALYFHIFLQVGLQDQEKPAAQAVWREIERGRRTTIRTRGVRAKTKFACILSYLGPRGTKTVFSILARLQASR